MTVVYVDLADYLAIAVEVTGLALDTSLRITDLNVADSALHAAAAGFGDTDFVADAPDRAVGTPVDRSDVAAPCSRSVVRCRAGG